MNKYFAGGYASATPPGGTSWLSSRAFNDLKVEYDFARQALRITSGDDTLHFTTDAALTGGFLVPLTSVSPHQVMQDRDRRL